MNKSFNTHSFAGVILNVRYISVVVNFNTHSFAGVIQRHLPNLGSKDPINFVRLTNALRSGNLSEPTVFSRSKTVGFPKSLWRHKISDHNNTSFL